MTPAELTAKVDEWRQKAAAGTLTVEECREALAFLRQGRVAASATSTKARTAKAAAAKKAGPINSDDLLSELDGL